MIEILVVYFNRDAYFMVYCNPLYYPKNKTGALFSGPKWRGYLKGNDPRGDKREINPILSQETLGEKPSWKVSIF